MFKQVKHMNKPTLFFSGFFGELDAPGISPLIPLTGCFSLIELPSLREVGMDVASAMGGDVRW